jgi:homoserine kinase
LARLETSSVTVRVPATSANLGPGFDSFGLALALYDEVSARVDDDGLRVEVAGEGSATLPRGEQNLVMRSLLAALGQLGSRPSGLRVQCRNVIPHGRGLGSSSAAIVAGISLANALSGAAGLDSNAMLALATDIEGHPDNVAACLFGGFTISWLESSAPACVRLEPAASIRPVVFVPTGTEVPTSLARTMLPGQVPFADAASNAARAALLAVAMTQRPDLLWAATQDRLHQHYRRAVMPASLDLLASLRSRGIAAAISGAGPSVLALTDPDGEPAVLALAPRTWNGWPLAVDHDGATLVPELE